MNNEAVSRRKHGIMELGGTIIAHHYSSLRCLFSLYHYYWHNYYWSRDLTMLTQHITSCCIYRCLLSTYVARCQNPVTGWPDLPRWDATCARNRLTKPRVCMRELGRARWRHIVNRTGSGQQSAAQHVHRGVSTPDTEVGRSCIMNHPSTYASTLSMKRWTATEHGMRRKECISISNQDNESWRLPGTESDRPSVSPYQLLIQANSSSVTHWSYSSSQLFQQLLRRFYLSSALHPSCHVTVIDYSHWSLSLVMAINSSIKFRNYCQSKEESAMRVYR